jgi:methyltransferase (TIGR00027 family)
MERPQHNFADDAERQGYVMKEYTALQEVGEDGLTWANKTAQWIAYERQFESEKDPSERLFNDSLAKHFVGVHGKRCSDVFVNSNKDMFGFDEGFANYHAARTKFISDQVSKWSATAQGDKQVINMGCGVDTRAFWDESLKGMQTYVEVDALAVNEYKAKVLEEVKAASGLPEQVCERLVVSMDFKKESTKDLPTHGVKMMPTCWVLEGLVMYLDDDSVKKLYEEICDLSPAGSLVIINIIVHQKYASP